MLFLSLPLCYIFSTREPGGEYLFGTILMLQLLNREEEERMCGMALFCGVAGCMSSKSIKKSGVFVFLAYSVFCSLLNMESSAGSS